MLKFLQKNWGYGVLLLSPLLGLFLLGMISECNVFEYDAWYSLWSDEIGYYKVVNIIKNQRELTSVPGYNEVMASSWAYGPYNVFTYLPYVLFSFITGTNSHNYIVYINVLMTVFAMILLLGVLKPSNLRVVALSIFFVFNPIYQRYVWSGMSEANIVMSIIVITVCSLYLFENMNNVSSRKTNIMILFWVATILYYGLIRPYLLVFILLPCVYLVCNQKRLSKKITYCIGCFVGAICVLCLYKYMGKHHCTPYFAVVGRSSLGDMYNTNGLLGAISYIVDKNREAIQFLCRDFQNEGWMGLVMFQYLIEVMILLWILKQKYRVCRERKGDIWLIKFFLLIGLCVYEAVIILYKVEQSHRMMLGIVIAYGLLICLIGYKKQFFAYCVIMLTVWIIGTMETYPRRSFAVPTNTQQYNIEKTMQEFKEVLVRSEKDKWDNTIAVRANDYNTLIYCLPEGIGTNTCQESYLLEVVENKTIKSKYLYCARDTEIGEVCVGECEILWENDGFVLFLLR